MTKRAFNRGSYGKSQEHEAYVHRRNTDERMRRFITDQGVLTFGRHQGVHIKKVPAPYIQWACDTMPGFKERYSLVNRSTK